MASGRGVTQQASDPCRHLATAVEEDLAEAGIQELGGVGGVDKRVQLELAWTFQRALCREMRGDWTVLAEGHSARGWREPSRVCPEATPCAGARQTLGAVTLGAVNALFSVS